MKMARNLSVEDGTLVFRRSTIHHMLFCWGLEVNGIIVIYQTSQAGHWDSQVFFVLSLYGISLCYTCIFPLLMAFACLQRRLGYGKYTVCKSIWWLYTRYNILTLNHSYAKIPVLNVLASYFSWSASCRFSNNNRKLCGSLRSLCFGE